MQAAALEADDAPLYKSPTTGLASREFRPVPSFTASDGATLHYEDTGAGRPIVLIPGWTMSTRFFDRNAGPLGEDHRVIVLDPRGHGQSEKVDYGHRLPRYSKDVYDLLEALDLDDATLVGWSLGASVLMSYYGLFGAHRASGFCFIDQTPKNANRDGWELGVPGVTAETSTNVSMILGDRAGLVDVFVPKMFHQMPADDDMAWMKAEAFKCPDSTAATLMLSHRAQDWRDVIERFAAPLLVMAGRQRAIYPFGSSEWIAKNAPNAELVTFEESGHCPFWEEAEKFNATLRRFAAETKGEKPAA